MAESDDYARDDEYDLPSAPRTPRVRYVDAIEQAGYRDALEDLREYTRSLPLAKSTWSKSQIQSRLDSKGAVVFPPDAVFDLGAGTEGLVFNGDQRAIGLGMTRTVLEYTGSGAALQINNGAITENAGASGFTVDCKNQAPYGIELGRVSGSPYTGTGLFTDLLFKRASAAACHLVFSAFGKWVRCNFASSRDGIWTDPVFGEGAPVTTQSFDACRAYSNTRYGLLCETGDALEFVGKTQFEDNGREGVLVRHPGAAYPDIAMRQIQFRGAYIEDNSTSSPGTYSNMVWDTVTSGLIVQVGHVENCRFQGSVGSGVKHHIDFNQGRFYEIRNEFLTLATGGGAPYAVNARDTSACLISAESDLEPTAYYVAGAAAKINFRKTGGDGVEQMWTNHSGTMKKRMTLAQGQAPLATDLNTLLTALGPSGLGLIRSS
jgi:hypothetical protein